MRKGVCVCMLYILSVIYFSYIYSYKYVCIYMEVVVSVLKIKGRDLKEAFGVFIMFLKNIF